jgi:small ligand-binding sensory domain FIST
VIAAGSGLVAGKRADEAALEASLAAMAARGGERADVALVSATADTHAHGHALLHAVWPVTGAPAVVGCSGAGALTERGEGQRGPAVSVPVVRGDGSLRARPFAIGRREGLDAEGGAAIAAQAGVVVAEGGALLILPDATNLDPRELLGCLAEGCGPVPGAVAAGLPLFELYATQVARGALPGPALSGGAPMPGVAPGCPGP